MLSRCALYVDAGYLLGSAASLVAGTSLRSSVRVDHGLLIDTMIKRAEAATGLPLLRVSWYDSGSRPGGLAGPEQEQIGQLPRVKLRLGRLSYSGEQKGVDLRIGLDLVTQARNRAVDIAYLVSGDDDLTEAVEEAQALGVELVVLAVPRSDGTPYGVSRHLQREADRLDVLEPDLVRAATTVVEAPSEPEKRPSPAMLASRRLPDAKVAGVPSSGVPGSVVPGAPVPGGAAPAGVPAPVGSRADAGLAHVAGGAGRFPTTYVEPPPVREITDAENEVIAQVCRGVLSAAGGDARGGLVAGRPTIPSDMDRALLQDLSSRLGIYELPDEIRYALRQQFWHQVDLFSA